MQLTGGRTIVLISIIVPVYNSQKYIKNCVASILNQSYKEWELILVDDGSKDCSGEICESFAKKNNKIHVCHKTNGGVSSARNVGIHVAQGDRVMFLDSDDELEVNTLELLNNVLNEYDYDVVCWALRTNSTKFPQYFPLSETKTYAKCGDLDLLDDLRCRAFTGIDRQGKKDHSMHFIVTKLIRRSLLLNHHIQFDESLKYHEDTLFTIDVLENATSIAAINEFLYIRNEHEGSASVSYYSEINKNNIKCIRMIEQLAKNRHSDDRAYSTAVDKYKLAWFIQSLKLCYMNEKNYKSAANRIRDIKGILKSRIYSIDGSLLRNDLKTNQRVLAFLINNKMAIFVYVLSKIIFRHT